MNPSATTATRVRHRDALRERGVRCTGARLAVLDALAAAGGHLTVTALHRRLESSGDRPDVSTVYRTVERLTDLGMVHRLRTSGESSYGLAFEPHHHAVCTDCGAVQEIPATALADTIRAALGASVFRVEDLVLNGFCPTCQEAAGPGVRVGGAGRPAGAG